MSFVSWLTALLAKARARRALIAAAAATAGFCACVVVCLLPMLLLLCTQEMCFCCKRGKPIHVNAVARIADARLFHRVRERAVSSVGVTGAISIASADDVSGERRTSRSGSATLHSMGAAFGVGGDGACVCVCACVRRCFCRSLACVHRMVRSGGVAPRYRY